MDSAQIPVIDLGHEEGGGFSRADATDEIRAAYENIGFFTVVGHGVPEETIGSMYAAARSFFTGPDTVKQEVLTDPLQRGYGHEDNRNRAIPLTNDYAPTFKLEFFTAAHIGENLHASGRGDELPNLLVPNKWPRSPGFRDTHFDYYAAMDALALWIMRLHAKAFTLPAGWFDDKLENHMTPLTVNYYPEQRVTAHGGTDPQQAAQGPGRGHGAVPGQRARRSPGVRALRGVDQRASRTGPLRRQHRRPPGEVEQRHPERYRPPHGRPARRRPRGPNLHRVFYQPAPDSIIECLPTFNDEAKPKYQIITSGDYFTATARRAHVIRERFPQ